MTVAQRVETEPTVEDLDLATGVALTLDFTASNGDVERQDVTSNRPTAAAATGEPAADPSSGAASWPWIVGAAVGGAVVLLIVIALIAMRSRTSAAPARAIPKGRATKSGGGVNNPLYSAQNGIAGQGFMLSNPLYEAGETGVGDDDARGIPGQVTDYEAASA